MIQILPRQAEFRWVYDAILSGNITLALTTEIILEYEETINEFYKSYTLGGNVTRLLLELSRIYKVDIYYRWQLIVQDPDDDKYVDCAVSANAELILTNDAHFKILEKVKFPTVTTMTLEQFQSHWKEQGMK